MKILFFIATLFIFSIYLLFDGLEPRRTQPLPRLLQILVPDKLEFELLNKSEKNIKKSIKNLKLMNDPLYRPIPVLNKFNYDKNAKIETINSPKMIIGEMRFGQGVVSIKACSFTTFCNIFYLNDEPILMGEHMEVIGHFKKSNMELLFFTEDCSGSGCGFPSIHLIRFIDGLGYGVEFLDVFQGGYVKELDFYKRLSVADDKIVIDLGRNNLMQKTIAVSPEGGNTDLSTPLPLLPVEKKSCDLLWDLLNKYLEEYKIKNTRFSYTSIHDYISEDYVCHVCYANFNYIENTQTGYDADAYGNIAEVVIKRKTLPIKNMFFKRVCGWNDRHLAN